MKIKISDIKKQISQIFLDRKFSDKNTEVIVNYLLWAEMSGKKTQGLLKMVGTEPLQDIQPEGDMVIERETKVSCLFNANKNPSIVASQKATDTVIEKAQQSGMGIVGVRNIFSSNGAQAYYAEQIAKKNLIGLVISRSPGAIAPFNSIDPLFGTNPIGFSFPTLKQPFVFDMASSAITFYGLILASQKGEKIEENLAIDSEGNVTMDPDKAMSGGILPFDRGYKGSCLALLVETLSGPLLNSAYCDYKTFEEEWGATFIAIDPEILVDVSDFKEHTSNMVKIIKESRTKNGEAIRLPGESARKKYNDSVVEGYIDLDEVIIERLGLR